jgi:SAM-dependent methyltransferase
VSCQDGDRVLDVACGTGLVASRVSLVSRKLCSVVGIDLNEAMLNVARRNSQVEWHQGNAMELPLESGSFDVVLCQQGLQYVPDRAAAMKEMARVLVPGGRLALNVWGGLDRQPFHAAVIDAVGEFLGATAKSAFDTAFSLNSLEELRHLAIGAELTNVRVRLEHRTMRYSSPAALARAFMVTTPIAAQFLALSDNQQQAMIAYVVQRLANFVDDAGLAVSQENHFLTTSKPV